MTQGGSAGDQVDGSQHLEAFLARSNPRTLRLLQWATGADAPSGRPVLRSVPVHTVVKGGGGGKKEGKNRTNASGKQEEMPNYAFAIDLPGRPKFDTLARRHGCIRAYHGSHLGTCDENRRRSLVDRCIGVCMPMDTYLSLMHRGVHADGHIFITDINPKDMLSVFILHKEIYKDGMDVLSLWHSGTYVPADRVCSCCHCCYN